MANSEAIVNHLIGLEGVSDQAHFEKRAFRTVKRIFATLDTANEHLMVKLTEVDQSVYATVQPESIYPVPNKWARQGWTRIHYNEIDISLILEIVEKAYRANCT